MKNTFYVVVIVFLLSCNQAQKAQPNEQAKAVVEEKSRYKTLLSKFREKNFDTLKVYSPEELTGEYKGVELDSADAILFPQDIAQQHFSDPPGIFAVYKFPIGNKRIGLIARTPAEYVPSSIKLFFYDIAKDTITSYIELAENWGDAGDYLSKNSWLYKDNGKDFKSLIWILEGQDNSVDNENDTTVQEWNYYYLLDLSKTYPDTISMNEKQLLRKFSHLLKQENTH